MDLETLHARRIDDEEHTSEQDKAPRPGIRLDLVVGRCARALAAALAGDTSVDRGIGHLVPRVRLGAAVASSWAAMVSGHFGGGSPTLAAGPHAIVPAFSQLNLVEPGIGPPRTSRT
jgi:hypothetical protein